jgi:Fe-S oxidoreductase
MSTDWREAGQTVEIEHHSELLARHKMRLPVAAEEDREKVVYHDPCYLGRYRGVYDEPREVLSRAVEVLEAPRNRERSFCCGAGGGQMFLGEEKGKRVNIAPFCASMFRDALKVVTNEPPKLLDIAQIAARSIEDAKVRR